MLTGPMRWLGMALGMAQRAVASGARVFELLDRAPRLVAAPDAPAPGGRRARGAAGRDLRLRRRRAGASRHRPRRGGRPDGRPRGADRLRQDDARDADPAPLRRDEARSSSTAWTCARSTRRRCAARWRWSRTTRSCSRRRSARTSPTRVLTRATRRSGGRRARRPRELLEELPEGLDTLVGERGLTLSGGQRQRVAIARALIAEPRILILDDATSSVDATTENRIKSALGEVMEGRTTFVIAHRLSTIALADEVVVLEDGEIVARGTHDELLETSPLYREIAEKGCPTRSSSRAATRIARWRACEQPRQPPSSPGEPAAPVPRARGADVRRAAARDGARSPRPTSRAARSTTASRQGHERAHDHRDRVPRGGAPELGRHLLQTYLINWVGQRALRTCASSCSAPPAALDRLLLAQQGRRPDLADRTTSRRSTSSSRRHLDAVLGDAHARRHGGDPGPARRGARDDHVPDLPGAAGGERGFRLASAGAYALTRVKIAHVTAYLQETLSGVRVVRAFGQEGATAAASRS